MTSAADIEAQAAAWVARCDARGDDQDPQLAAWLVADPRHRAAYLRLAQAWERSQRLARLRPADRAIDPDLLAPSRPPNLWARISHRAAIPARNPAPAASTWGAPAPRPARSATAALLSMGVAAAVLLVLWNLMPPSSIQSYRTGPGGLSRVVLRDGSAVTMNADTQLRVRFTAAKRTVTLLRGEAHFSVTHDTQRPFEVYARDRVVVAVGTAFDVRLAPGHDVVVTVTEGRVALLKEDDGNPPPGSFPLHTISAGQDALLTTKDVVIQRVDTAEIFHRLAWERRELSFDGQTLSQAVAEFDRYTNRKIVIDDPSIASLEIGGSFRALDIESFISALGRAFGISSRITTQGTIHLYRAHAR